MPGHQDYDGDQDDLFVTEAATLIGGFQRAGVLSEDDVTALLAEHCGITEPWAAELIGGRQIKGEIGELLLESQHVSARRGWTFLAAAFAAGVLVGWRWTR